MHGTGRLGRSALFGRLILLTLLTALALTGCSQPAELDTQVEEPATQPEEGSLDEPSRSEVATVSVSVSGAIFFEWKQQVPLQIVTLRPPERLAQLLSVGILDFVPVSADDPHEHFRFAFDLAGGYGGAGTYVVPAVGDGADDGGISGPSMSSAFLIYLTFVDPALEQPHVPENYENIRRFDRALQDCVLEVGEHESTGSLDCPELADSEGNTIHLQARWTLLG